MIVARLSKTFALTALFGGVLALMAPEGLRAANKVEEAKKYTLQLKLSKDAKQKVAALNELGDLGRLMKALVADAMPDMVASLKDKEPTVRAAAATAVGKCDPGTEGINALVDILKNEKEESVKLAALKGLAAAGPGARSALPAIREISKKEDKKSKLAKAAQDASRSIGQKK